MIGSIKYTSILIMRIVISNLSSVETLALSRNSGHCHCAARSEHWCAGGIYRLSILVSADAIQPIQKIISIGWIMLAYTINHIFGIGCTMSADTNNVSGIRRVLRQRKTLIEVKFGLASSGYPIFPPSMPLPPSMPPSPPSTPCRRRHYCQPQLRPRCRAITNPVPDPAFGLDAAGGVPVVVPNPITVPDPVAPSLRRSVLS
jgi:hypothetical protein